MLKGLSAIAPAGAVQTSVRDLARWLTFHATRSPGLLGEGMWRELHRPQAQMPAPDQPEVQHPYYALGWIHESYRGHPLVVHNGAIDGFTVHLGFLPETGQGLILLMNRDLARRGSDGARLQRLRSPSRARAAGLGGKARGNADAVAGRPGSRARLSDRRGGGEIRASRLRGAHGPGQRGQARDAVSDSSLSRWSTRANGGFSAWNPSPTGPRRSRFGSRDTKTGEPLKLFVPLNFDEGDPVEVFTRVR